MSLCDGLSISNKPEINYNHTHILCTEVNTVCACVLLQVVVITMHNSIADPLFMEQGISSRLVLLLQTTSWHDILYHLS